MRHTSTKAMCIQDFETKHTLATESKLVDGHYKVAMMWDEKRTALPNNYSVALKRYNFLEKR